MKKIVLLFSVFLMALSAGYARNAVFYTITATIDSTPPYERTFHINILDSFSAKATEIAHLRGNNIRQSFANTYNGHIMVVINKGIYGNIGNPYVSKLYSVNPDNGHVDTLCIVGDEFAALRVNSRDGKIYTVGTRAWGVPEQEPFVRLDTLTGNVDTLDSFPAHYLGLTNFCAGLDSRRGTYFAYSDSANGYPVLKFFSLSSGKLIQYITLPPNHFINVAAVDERTGKIYGLLEESNSQKDIFFSVDPSVPSCTLYDSFNRVTQGFPELIEIDTVRNLFFTLFNYNWNTNASLRSYDLTTGRQVGLRTLQAEGFWMGFMPGAPAYPYTLQGEIKTSASARLKQSRVYLAKYSSVDTTVVALDSMLTDSMGRYRFHSNDPKVFVLALPDSANYPFELPTWYDTSLTWDSTGMITLSAYTPAIKNFSTRSGTNPGGSGFIGGTVYACVTCKKAGTGKPVANLRLVLVDSKGQGVASTYTDKNGSFSFGHLANGKYSVYVDKPMLKNTVAPVVELTTAGQVKKDLSFTLYPEYLELNVVSAVTAAPGLSGVLSLYPNPASTQVRCTFTLEKAAQVSIELYSMEGKLIGGLYNGVLQAGIQQLNLSLSNQLSRGVYTIKFITGETAAYKKLVINH